MLIPFHSQITLLTSQQFLSQYPPRPQPSLASRLAQAYDNSPVIGVFVAWFGISALSLAVYSQSAMADTLLKIEHRLGNLESVSVAENATATTLPAALAEPAQSMGALHARSHYQKEMLEVAEALHRLHARLDEIGPKKNEATSESERDDKETTRVHTHPRLQTGAWTLPL